MEPEILTPRAVVHAWSQDGTVCIKPGYMIFAIHVAAAAET